MPQTQQYQGKTVTVVRTAVQGDPSFDANKDQASSRTPTALRPRFFAALFLDRDVVGLESTA